MEVGEVERMKGMSVVLSFALLVIAQQLAWHLSRAGALPRQRELSPGRSESVRRAMPQLLRARFLAPSRARAGESEDASDPIFQL